MYYLEVRLLNKIYSLALKHIIVYFYDMEIQLYLRHIIKEQAALFFSKEGICICTFIVLVK